MEEIKNTLTTDFNYAVEAYNQKNYVQFFRNIRPAIENLCKLLICDLIANENDYHDIIEGKKDIVYKDGAYSFADYASRKPSGAHFTVLFQKAFFLQKPSDRSNKVIRVSIDSYSSDLSRFYSVASEIGSHAGKSQLDIEAQTESCAATLRGFFDFMKTHQIVSPATIQYLDSLAKFKTNSALEERIKDLEQELSDKITTLEQIIKEQNVTIAELDKLLEEANAKQTSMEDLLKSKEKEVEELLKKQNQIDAENARKDPETHQGTGTVTPQPKKKRFGGIKERILKDFDVDTSSMDDDQIDLIDRTLDKSMIVAGCAGSGKSVIAMHKAHQILESGGDVILIAYTKSLNRYMSQGKANHLDHRFMYHWQWENQGKPSADYVIVDEIQDFDKEEIMQFVKAARKCFFFFGDTAQSIYNAFGKKTMTIDEISEMTDVKVSRLYNNYRLPKPVARITQDYLGLNETDNVMPFTEKVYLSKETTLPKFIKCTTAEEQIVNMIDFIQKEKYRNVGILVPDNETVLDLMQHLTQSSFPCEVKYNAGYNDERNIDTLNFKSEKPKIMTYHSAKGLQFETVILPFYKGATTKDELKALYVAMTRTYRNLYVLYTNVIASPLKDVPGRLCIHN